MMEIDGNHQHQLNIHHLYMMYHDFPIQGIEIPLACLIVFDYPRAIAVSTVPSGSLHMDSSKRHELERGSSLSLSSLSGLEGWPKRLRDMSKVHE